MFLKPFRIKSQTNTKGSDRKKVRNEVSQQYPSFTEEDLKQVIPQKEDMSTMKIYTHAGHNVTVYVVNKNPIFFEIDGNFFPTVYTLWKNPTLMPVLTTWPPVLPKLIGGADLMLPGVVVKGDLDVAKLGNMEKGAPCAVKLLGNKAPVAVGRSALSSSDMIDAAMRGKGVKMVHTFQDQLWALGEKSNPPELVDEEFVSFEGEPNEDVNDTTEDTGELADGDNATRDNTEPDNVSEKLANVQLVDDELQNQGRDSEENKDLENDMVESEPEELDPQQIKDEMDSLLLHCFKCALKTNVHKTDLPLLTSKFFRNHLVPFCPKNKSIDIKKSSYKKLSKFLQEMQKQGFLKVKELSKGVESITQIDKNHPELRSYEVEMIEDDDSLPEEDAGATAAPDYQVPQIIEMVTISGAAANVFQRRGKTISIPEMRNALTNYIKDNELNNTDSNRVTLDGHLSDLLLQKGEYKEQLTWEEVFSRCQNKLSPAYAVIVAGKEPVIKKGKPTPVTLNVATRAGNKKVTLIENLEVFGISPDELAHKVQLGVACSSTVTPLPGKNKGMQVLVQGNQINYIADLLLDTYKLPKKWISGLEKAPKSGKKNR